MTTMHEEYGDGSDHKICDKCKMCIVCGDCYCGKDMPSGITISEHTHSQIKKLNKTKNI